MEQAEVPERKNGEVWRVSTREQQRYGGRVTAKYGNGRVASQKLNAFCYRKPFVFFQKRNDIAMIRREPSNQVDFTPEYFNHAPLVKYRFASSVFFQIAVTVPTRTVIIFKH